MRIVNKSTNERGDTIVEVLICILVISTMLAGAFVTTNNSLQAVRMAQERSQAVKLAESQIEQLRAIGSGTYTSVGSSFCITAGVFNNAPGTPGSTSCYLKQNGELIAAANVGTQTSSAGNLYANSANGPQFNTRVIVGANNTYEVSVRWVSVKGQLSNITMYYRLPQL